MVIKQMPKKAKDKQMTPAQIAAFEAWRRRALRIVGAAAAGGGLITLAGITPFIWQDIVDRRHDPQFDNFDFSSIVQNPAMNMGGGSVKKKGGGRKKAVIGGLAGAAGLAAAAYSLASARQNALDPDDPIVSPDPLDPDAMDYLLGPIQYAYEKFAGPPDEE